MEKINEHLYQANIELVDKNKLLEQDKKILTKRINKAIEYIKENEIYPESSENNYVESTALLNILKGRYFKNV